MTFDEIMSFDKSGINEKVFDSLKDLLMSDRKPYIVPFIGAGLSAGLGFPTWRRFLEQGFKSLPAVDMPKDFFAAAEWLLDLKGYAEFYALVREQFDKPVDEWKANREAVGLLPMLFNGLVLTTNFDLVLECVYQRTTPVAHPGHTEMLNLAIVEKKPLIYKVHGSIEEAESIIFTKSAYDKAYAVGTELVKDLGKCFSGSILLFLGCSLEKDMTLDLLRKMVPDIPGVTHYALLSCNSDDLTRRRKELGDQRIRAILYPNGEFSCVRVVLEKLLQCIDHDAWLQLPGDSLRYHGNNPFKYNAKTVQFFGREEELENLERFLNVDIPFQWTTITGIGGSGKTRLGYEFTEKVRGRSGWDAPGILSRYTLEDLKRHKITKNTLFVLDYVKWKAKVIEQWLESLFDAYSNDISSKIRVILIEREEKGIGYNNWSHNLLESRFQDVLALKPLDRVMPQIIEGYSKNVYGKRVNVKLICETLAIIDPNFRRPLYALFLTDAQLCGENMMDWKRKDALEYVCRRERERIKNSLNGLPYLSSSPAEYEESVYICQNLLMLATLSGGLELETAKKLMPDQCCKLDDIGEKIWFKGDMAKILVHAGVIPTEKSTEKSNTVGFIPPLEPDLIGEYYFIIQLRQLHINGKEMLENIFDYAKHTDTVAVWRMLDRIIRDFKDDLSKAEYDAIDTLRDRVFMESPAISRAVIDKARGSKEKPAISQSVTDKVRGFKERPAISRTVTDKNRAPKKRSAISHAVSDKSQLLRDSLEAARGVTIEEATIVDCYYALAILVREQIMKQWIKTSHSNEKDRKKQVYYFSMEFLLGKMLKQNLISLNALNDWEETLKSNGIDPEDIYAVERNPGLGCGSLGMTATGFMDALAFLGISGNGCGIRYKYGYFEQKIVDGYQIELPDRWLSNDMAWEIRKPYKAVLIRFFGNIKEEIIDGRVEFRHENYEPVIAIPYDVPIAGYHNGTVNTLRLWSAEAIEQLDLGLFSCGDYLGAVSYKYSVEAISEVLYPDDSNYQNKMLRLKQQYFLVAAGLQSIIRHFKKSRWDIPSLADYVAIHINDTHPALVIPELMRILMDEEGLGWDKAWDITVATISYTNHTIMAEAMEKWPVDIFSKLLPRIYMIVHEINKRFCMMLFDRFNGDLDKVGQMAIIVGDEILATRLAIVGSHAVNGAPESHSKVVKTLFSGFYEVFPERFHSQASGAAHRKWVLQANPDLSNLISEAIGPDWITEPLKLAGLEKMGFVRDKSFLALLRQIKRNNKLRLAEIIEHTQGFKVNPDSIFDIHATEIHARKRQLLLLLNVLDQYYTIIENPRIEVAPRTIIIAGKSAPNYYFAKEIVKFVNVVAERVNNDPKTRDLIKVVFLENYNVSLAESVYPASDLSEQISAVGIETSGTGKFKFMMNGAVTIGTIDDTNAGFFEAIGDGNFIPFGITVPEVLELNRNHGYNSREFLNGHDRLKRIVNGFMNTRPDLPGSAEFPNIYKSLTSWGDTFFVMKDFDAYAEAQENANSLYQDTDIWASMSAMNIARSGRFASDEIIKKFAIEIWNV